MLAGVHDSNEARQSIMNCNTGYQGLEMLLGYKRSSSDGALNIAGGVYLDAIDLAIHSYQICSFNSQTSPY